MWWKWCVVIFYAIAVTALCGLFQHWPSHEFAGLIPPLPAEYKSLENQGEWRAFLQQHPIIPKPKPKPKSVTNWHTAIVSWYGPKWDGRRTASGTRFDHRKLTCAHKTMKFGTKVQFEYHGKTVTCVVTDRGPYIRGRSFDLTTAAFARLAPLSRGILKVRWRIVK